MTNSTTTAAVPLAAAGSSSSNDNQISVAIRVRPLSVKESSAGFYNAIRVDERTNEITLTDRPNGKQHKFASDHVITDQCSTKRAATQQQQRPSSDAHAIADAQQQFVYESIGQPLLARAFDGYNVSIFAYGQTGSGKTYSMIGTSEQPGLIPRFFDELFERKAARDKIVSSTHLEISYYEIYNEKIYDLLRSSSTSTTATTSGDTAAKTTATATVTAPSTRALQVREHPQTGPYSVDLLTLSASSAADAKLWLELGNKKRATACTNMNHKSSRSHSVFQINLTQMLEHKNNENALSNQVEDCFKLA